MGTVPCGFYHFMIEVVAGILLSNNRVLIAKRKKGKHLAGYWEFPGGKVENSETTEKTLVREFSEEFDVVIRVNSEFHQNIHSYSDTTILLKSYLAELIKGDFKLKDHDRIEWVKISDLKNYKVASADIPIVEKQRAESKAEIEQLTSEKKEIESRIDTSLELLVDGRVPKERVIIKMQEDEQRLRDLQEKIIKVEEIKTPTAEDLEVFRNQLRIQVEGELDIDTKKSVLNSLIKKLKVDQNGLLEIDFGVALGNTPYTSYLLRGFE